MFHHIVFLHNSNMNRSNNARSKNLSIYGNVRESFDKLFGLIPPNDGSRKFTILSSEAYNLSLPLTGEGQETHIDLTASDHMMSQINDSFLICDSSATIRIPELTGSNYAGESPIVFFGFKSSNQIFRQMKILLDGRETDYLSTECVRENYAFSMCKGKAEKKSKKHVHTLYEDVAQYKLGVCGTYLPLSNWKNPQRQSIVNIRCIVPISDLLPLQSFSLYPSNIIGQLAIKAAFTMRGLVWTQVDPVHVLECNNFLNNTLLPLDAKFGNTAFFDRFFHQINDAGYLLDEDLSPSYISQRVTPTLVAFSVNRLSCQKMGFNFQESSYRTIAERLASEPLFIPAQEMDYHAYAVQPSGGAFSGSLNIRYDNTECITLMFPTTQNQLTVFKNPNLQNLQVKIENTLYPPTSISTNSEISPELLTFLMNASDLDGTIEPTESWLYSIINPRLDSLGNRLANTRMDDTDFALTFSTERSQGGYVFDGLTTESSVNTELRFSPVVSGPNDVYYIPDPAVPTMHPPAPELWICNDSYWVVGPKTLKYVTSGSPR